MFPLRDLNPRRGRPLITLGLVLLNIAVFAFWQPHSGASDEAEFLYAHAVIPCEVTTGEPLSVPEINQGVCVDGGGGTPAFPDKNVWLAGLVSMILHANLFHLLTNMWVLYVFGDNIEDAYGHIGYLAMYLAAGIIATAAFVFAHPDGTVPLLGASGAIAGVLGSYLVLYPKRRVISLVVFWIVPVPAAVFLGIWFLSQFLVVGSGVAWEAHVGGFIAGAAITLLLRPILEGGGRRRRATG